jgi:hypothetical protein
MQGQGVAVIWSDLAVMVCWLPFPARRAIIFLHYNRRDRQL